MPRWEEYLPPLRPEEVPETIPGYQAPPPQVLEQPQDLALAPPPPLLQLPQPELPELPAESVLGQLEGTVPPPAPKTPEEIEADRLQAARQEIGYEPVTLTPEATVEERVAAESASAEAEAAAQALMAQQQFAEERQRLQEAEALREAAAAERLQEAEKRAAAGRETYRDVMKKSGAFSGTQVAGLVAAALMDALAVSLQPTGQQQSHFSNVMDVFLKTNQNNWDKQVAAALDFASEGQEEVDRLVARERESKRQYELQRAAVAEAVAAELDLIAARGQGQIQAINARNAAALVRQQQAAAQAAAAREDYKLETGRLSVVGELESKAKSLELRAQELEQRERESRRQAAVARRGQDISLEKERMRAELQRQLKTVDLEATKAERQRKMMVTGQLIDSATGKPIVTSRFYEKPEQMIKDQDIIDDYVTAQKKFNEYIDLLKKVGRVGPVEGRLKDDVQKRLDMLHQDILSATVRALSGAATSKEEIERISATIPGPKSWLDWGDWDPVKLATKYAAGMGDEIDNMLRGRALPGQADLVEERSPTARFRALSRGPANTVEDTIQTHVLHRDPVVRNQMAISYLRHLKNGTVSQQEAETIVRALTDVATADILNEKDTKIYRKYAEMALNFYEQRRDQWTTKPGLRNTIKMGDAWMRGDMDAMRRATGDKTPVEKERKDIAERRRRILGE
jgi:hypothetical protein